MIRQIIKGRWAYFFISPWFILFSIFMLIPFIIGIIISFTNYNFANYNFVFLDNYKQIFKQKLFLKAIFTSGLIASIVVSCSVSLALWIANSIRNSKKSFQTFVKAGLYIPGVVCSVALVITWKWIFNPAYGLTKYIAGLLGVRAIDWYGVTENALFLIIVLLIGLFMGLPVILYSAAINAIPKDLYEAADVDGATEWQKFIRITFPLVKPTTLYLSIVGLIGGLQVFEIPLLLTAGGPTYNTTTVMLLLYRTAFNYDKFGRAAAMGVILFIVIAIFSFIQLRMFKSDLQY